MAASAPEPISAVIRVRHELRRVGILMAGLAGDVGVAKTKRRLPTRLQAFMTSDAGDGQVRSVERKPRFLVTGAGEC